MSLPRKITARAIVNAIGSQKWVHGGPLELAEATRVTLRVLSKGRPTAGLKDPTDGREVYLSEVA